MQQLPEILGECVAEMADEREVSKAELEHCKALHGMRERATAAAHSDEVEDLKHELLQAHSNLARIEDDMHMARLRVEKEAFRMELAVAKGREDALNNVIDRHLMGRD